MTAHKIDTHYLEIDHMGFHIVRKFGDSEDQCIQYIETTFPDRQQAEEYLAKK